MRNTLFTLALATMISTPAIAQEETPPIMTELAETAAVPLATATADVLGGDGNSVGTATFTQGTLGTLMYVKLAGLPAGKHGMHLHKLGTCDHADHFKSASGHINPSDKKHGYFNEEGPEIGDLPNIFVAEDGSVELEIFMPQIDVSSDKESLLDEDGTSLMIHADPDDHITQPIGGAGDRIACGVIKPIE